MRVAGHRGAGNAAVRRPRHVDAVVVARDDAVRDGATLRAGRDVHASCARVRRPGERQAADGHGGRGHFEDVVSGVDSGHQGLARAVGGDQQNRFGDVHVLVVLARPDLQRVPGERVGVVDGCLQRGERLARLQVLHAGRGGHRVVRHRCHQRIQVLDRAGQRVDVVRVVPHAVAVRIHVREVVPVVAQKAVERAAAKLVVHRRRGIPGAIRLRVRGSLVRAVVHDVVQEDDAVVTVREVDADVVARDGIAANDVEVAVVERDAGVVVRDGVAADLVVLAAVVHVHAVGVVVGDGVVRDDVVVGIPAERDAHPVVERDDVVRHRVARALAEHQAGPRVRRALVARDRARIDLPERQRDVVAGDHVVGHRAMRGGVHVDTRLAQAGRAGQREARPGHLPRLDIDGVLLRVGGLHGSQGCPVHRLHREARAIVGIAVRVTGHGPVVDDHVFDVRAVVHEDGVIRPRRGNRLVNRGVGLSRPHLERGGRRDARPAVSTENQRCEGRAANEPSLHFRLLLVWP